MENQWVSCAEPIGQTGGLTHIFGYQTLGVFVDDPFSFSLPTMNKHDKTSGLAWNIMKFYLLPVMPYFLIFFCCITCEVSVGHPSGRWTWWKDSKNMPDLYIPSQKDRKKEHLKIRWLIFLWFLGLAKGCYTSPSPVSGAHRRRRPRRTRRRCCGSWGMAHPAHPRGGGLETTKQIDIGNL